METLGNQPFVTSEEPVDMMEAIATLVSRDKLIEWERFAFEKHFSEQDRLFPSVRPWALALSVLIFVISMKLPLIPTADIAARKCLSILLLALSLWITEAVPYFATAVIIPPCIVFMDVLKDPSTPGRNLSKEQAAQFVMEHMFNHTTVRCLQ